MGGLVVKLIDTMTVLLLSSLLFLDLGVINSVVMLVGAVVFVSFVIIGFNDGYSIQETSILGKIGKTGQDRPFCTR